MRVHSVTNEIMIGLDASSKLIAEWDFFCLLRDKGRRSAQAFLESHTEDLGRRSTLHARSRRLAGRCLKARREVMG